MTSSDMATLAAYYRINPWGPWRDDLRVAQLSAMTYNVNRGKNQQPMSALDFIHDPIRARKQEQAKDEAFLAMLDLKASRSDDSGKSG